MFHPRGTSCYITYNLSFQTLVVRLSTKISIGTEMVFSPNRDKMSKMIFLMGYRFVYV